MAGLSAAGWHPRMARAAAGERKFLFFFAGGAWDSTAVFDPHYDTSYIDMDEETWIGTAGGLEFTAGNDRPMVSRFFQRWGNRAAIVNGLDAHTVGHDTGMQMTMTGTSASSFSDWPTLLAANGRGEYPLPHLVFGGPSYPGVNGHVVVRAGGGTLVDLIDGSIVGEVDNPAPQLTRPADAIIDAFVHDRTVDFAAQKGTVAGTGRRRVESLLGNLERSMELEGRRFEAGLTDLGSSLADQAIKATEMMRLGLSRSAIIGIPGGWDSHGDNTVQGPQFNDFFEALDQLMDHMAVTPGQSARWLIDEVVVVALSEFGRTPLLNGGNGKDHWPFTSALVVGSGVRGNQVVGATDDGLVGLPIDFSTGLASDTGDMLGTENLGCALLELGGLDPADFLPGIQPLRAILR